MAGASRVASNFVALMADTWQEVAVFAGTTIVWGVLWAIGLFLVGIGVGVFVYLMLRRWGAFGAPWSWYRYVRWLWGVVFILSAAVGFAYAGAWLGPGRNVKHYIRDERMIDRVVGNLYFAIILDKADYQATGLESAEQLEKVLTESEALANLAVEDWEAVRDEAVQSAADNFLDRWVLELAADSATEKLTQELGGLDARVIVGILHASPSVEAYLRDHPDAHPLVASVATHFSTIREDACGLVDAVVMPHVWGGIGLGLGGPLVLAGVFAVIRRLGGKGRPKRIMLG